MAISTALLISATYIKYTDLLKETHIQQANSTQSYQHRLHILFSQYETIHHLVGEQHQKNTFGTLSSKRRTENQTKARLFRPANASPITGPEKPEYRPARGRARILLPHTPGRGLVFFE